MTTNQNKRIVPARLRADLDALTILQTFGDYRPANPAYAASTVKAKLDALKAAQEVELNAQNVLAAARDAAVACEWDFHNALLGVKAQVIAQYGASSDQIQAIGLKKKSERKAPRQKRKPAS